MVCFGFRRLLDPGMQEANIGDDFPDCLTFNGEDQAQHSMRAWMLRPHVDGHAIGTQVSVELLAVIDCILICYLLLLHIFSFAYERDTSDRYEGFIVLPSLSVPGSWLGLMFTRRSSSSRPSGVRSVCWPTPGSVL